VEPCEYAFSNDAGLLFKESPFNQPHTLVKEETREISDYQIYFLIPIKWQFISMAIEQVLATNLRYEIPSEIKIFLFTFKEVHGMIDALIEIHTAIIQTSVNSKFFIQTSEDNSFLFRWNLRRTSQIEKKLSCFALELIADFTTPSLFKLLCERQR
jgi:hypothetical protein